MRVFALCVIAISVTAIVTGCASAVPSGIEGRWSLTSVAGSPPDVPGSIELTATGISMETGCNKGGGTYRIQGGRLLVPDVSLTKMACPGPAGHQQTVFLHLMVDGPVISLAGNRLALDVGDGRGALVFTRMPSG